MSKVCYLNTFGVICAAGDCKNSLADALHTKPGSFPTHDVPSAQITTPVGEYSGALPQIPLDGNHWHSRNNQFALAAIEQIRDEIDSAIAQFGHDRIGVVIGTSTSGISDSERYIEQWVQTGELPDAYNYRMQEMGATAEFAATLIGATGPVYGISTACSSGAKAIASAQRLIECDLCDVVVAGGVDTLCQLTIQGFSSLEAVSESRCNPFSRNRDGINIGEGAALFLVSRQPTGVALLGAGESSDAHHISAPDPHGAGALGCMSSALANANMDAAKVDYINLHGTATPLNDAMEAGAVHELFGGTAPCSSTKPYTGHTLGAAGAIEAAICWLAIERGFTPAHHWDGETDPGIASIKLVSGSESARAPRYALSNSFAFGGNNISLLLGQPE